MATAKCWQMSLGHPSSAPLHEHQQQRTPSPFTPESACYAYQIKMTLLSYPLPPMRRQHCSRRSGSRRWWRGTLPKCAHPLSLHVRELRTIWWGCVKNRGRRKTPACCPAKASAEWANQQRLNLWRIPLQTNFGANVLGLRWPKIEPLCRAPGEAQTPS